MSSIILLTPLASSTSAIASSHHPNTVSIARSRDMDGGLKKCVDRCFPPRPKMSSPLILCSILSSTSAIASSHHPNTVSIARSRDMDGGLKKCVDTCFPPRPKMSSPLILCSILSSTSAIASSHHPNTVSIARSRDMDSGLKKCVDTCFPPRPKMSSPLIL
ncbi:hypothetical protein GEMRC1_011774 [Eukaryota sp. GEM-RC1]